MGIINVTPDSFSDGGQLLDAKAAIDAGLQMVEDGADLLDIGGESTRPGAQPTPEAEERRRILPVIEALASRVQVPVSVDTYKASTADAALSAGASLVNDVSGLRYEPDLAAVVAKHGVPIILMHTRGRSRDMYPGCVLRGRRRGPGRGSREHGVCRRSRHSPRPHARRPRSGLREGGAPQLRGSVPAAPVRR